MDNDFTELNAEIRELRNELRQQSGDLLDLRMASGDIRADMKSLRSKLDAMRDLPFSLESYPGLKELLDHYLEIILKITDTGAGSVILVEDDGPADNKHKATAPNLVFFSSSGPAAERLRGWHFSGGEGIAGLVARTGEPYFSEDAENDPVWSGEVSRAVNYHTKDIICVPMRSDNRVIGVIEALNRKGAPYTKDDLDIMSFIASHASVMVRNYRLLADYDAKVRHLSTLMELSNLLNSSLRTDEVRRRAIEASTSLMDADAGSLLLVDESTGELYFEVALGDEDKESAIKEIRLRPGEGIAGWVAKEAESVIINDVHSDPRFFSEADEKAGFVTRNMLCVPVMARGEVIGVLQAINKKAGRDFSETDRASLESLANQVAIAIENSMLYDRLKRTFLDTSETLADAIEKRDPYTGGHTRRVLRYSAVIARHMGMAPDEIERVELAAVLHDVGKIGVSDTVLRKQGPLDDEEFSAMKRHPELGSEIMSHVTGLSDILPGINSHHERLDGKGYPEGVTEDGIPMMARIISVADSFDAMTTDRPYREGLSVEYALSELRRCSRSQFDPRVVDAFISALESGEVIVGDVSVKGGS